MKKVFKFFCGLMVAAMIAPTANATTINDDPEDDVNVDQVSPISFPVVIVNNTGFGIDAIYISDSDSDDWSDNWLDERLENGEEVRIMCADPGKYDIAITYYNDVECELYGINFQKATTVKITLSDDGTTTNFSY